MNDDLLRHRGEVLRALSNHKYEVMENGGILLRAGINAIPMGVFDHEHRRFDLVSGAKSSALRKAIVESRAIRGLGRARHIGSPFRALRRWGKGGGDLLDRGIGSNVIPTQGLNHILATEVGGGTQVNPWYVALFEGNVTPSASYTAANFTANATECTAYDEAARVAYVEGTASGGAIDNAASRAIFTMNATKTVYGGALLSVSTKSSTSGFLLAAARFASVRNVEDDDELSVRYSLTLTPA